MSDIMDLWKEAHLEWLRRCRIERERKKNRELFIISIINIGLFVLAFFVLARIFKS
jgi:biopolymer transport protein ExbD